MCVPPAAAAAGTRAAAAVAAVAAAAAAGVGAAHSCSALLEEGLIPRNCCTSPAEALVMSL